MKRIAIFGGSFDPIHLGHINTTLTVSAHFAFDKLLFLPCKQPVLKNATVASAEQRIEMLQLAISPYQNFDIDTREIKRDGPSYMIDTLKSFREEYGPHLSLTLILGMDAFTSLPKWHQFKDILKFSHLLVLKRPGAKLPSSILTRLLTRHQVFDKRELFTSSHGSIFFFDAGHYIISSSEIRKKINLGEDISNEVTTEINQYLMQRKIYHN